MFMGTDYKSALPTRDIFGTEVTVLTVINKNIIFKFFIFLILFTTARKSKIKSARDSLIFVLRKIK
jgi:hypothetical protein